VGENPRSVSEMSGSSSAPLMNGPESAFVVAAVDAMLRRDLAAARKALVDGAEATGWEAIAHRLDVAGHALAVDAGLQDDHPTDHIVLLPDLDTSSWTTGRDDAIELLTRWTADDFRPDDTAVDRVWSSLAVVTWLVDRAGYPAEVVV
jgi:hypothetical protein